MCNVTFQTLILLMYTIVTKAKIKKNQNVDISTVHYLSISRSGNIYTCSTLSIHLSIYLSLVREICIPAVHGRTGI